MNFNSIDKYANYHKMKNIAIFASGSGTNAENIITYFSNRNTAKVTLVFSNKREALVLKGLKRLIYRTVFFDHKEFYVTGKVLDTLLYIKLILLFLQDFYGLFLRIFLNNITGRIINIHPAFYLAMEEKECMEKQFIKQ